MTTRAEVNTAIANILDSALTLRFVIGILCATITLSISSGIFIFKATQTWDAQGEKLDKATEAVAELRVLFATRAAKLDADEADQNARLTGLESRVGLLEYIANHGNKPH